MQDIDSRLSDTIASWVRALPDDLASVAEVIEQEAVAKDARRLLIGTVNHELAVAKWMPTETADISAMCLALLMRTAVDMAWPLGLSRARNEAALAKLKHDVDSVRSLLQSDYAQIEKMVTDIAVQRPGGRSCDDIMEQGEAMSAFRSDLERFSRDHAHLEGAPSERALAKLRAFLAHRLLHTRASRVAEERS
jgi:hypothetical protein